jgi:hypothetical protein
MESGAAIVIEAEKADLGRVETELSCNENTR